MGRKIDMKKIQDITRCQVTFSKRRSSVMKKAKEISVCCDVDVAFVAFSPSGRITKFSNQKRIEDVFCRYMDLPADQRLNHISNVQEKLLKMRHLGHINNDIGKLQYLDKQIENLELQIKKSSLELQIAETGLRDYEVGHGTDLQDHSLHQLSWCEKNLHQALEKVIARKNALSGIATAAASTPYSLLQSNTLETMDQMGFESGGGIPFPSNLNNNGQLENQHQLVNPFTGEISLIQLGPEPAAAWISPSPAYSSSARVLGESSIFQGLFDNPENYLTNEIDVPISFTHNILEPAEEGVMLTPRAAEITSPHISAELQQSILSLLADQEPSLLLDSHRQTNAAAAWNWNNSSSASFSGDAIHVPSQSSSKGKMPLYDSFSGNAIHVPSQSSSKGKMPLYDDEMNLNSAQYLSNMELVNQLDTDYWNSSGKMRIDDLGDEDYWNDEAHLQAPHYVPQPKEGTLGDGAAASTSGVKGKDSLCEWDDLLLDENDLNIQQMFSEK